MTTWNKILTPPTPRYFLSSVLGTSSTKHVSYIGVLKVQSCFWASKNQAHTFFQSFTFMANILKIYKLPMLAQYDSLYTRCLWTMVWISASLFYSTQLFDRFKFLHHRVITEVINICNIQLRSFKPISMTCMVLRKWTNKITPRAKLLNVFFFIT